MMDKIGNSLPGAWGKVRGHLGPNISHALIVSYPDDAYIVSYPRSGNTWMRTMLGYLLDPACASSYKMLKALIPGVSFKNLPEIYRLKRPRLLKSHSWYRKSIPKALYIVRDGRDVLVSLYHYLITRRKRAESFAVFFDNYCCGVYGHQWHENVESWLTGGAQSLGERMFLIRFEDLKADTKTTLGKITQFFNIPATPGQLEAAIAASSLEQMRQVEQAQLGKVTDPNQSVYRGGRTGGWKEYFTPALESRFIEFSAKALALAGYPIA